MESSRDGDLEDAGGWFLAPFSQHVAPKEKKGGRGWRETNFIYSNIPNTINTRWTTSKKVLSSVTNVFSPQEMIFHGDDSYHFTHPKTRVDYWGDVQPLLNIFPHVASDKFAIVSDSSSISYRTREALWGEHINPIPPAISRQNITGIALQIISDARKLPACLNLHYWFLC